MGVPSFPWEGESVWTHLGDTKNRWTTPDRRRYAMVRIICRHADYPNSQRLIFRASCIDLSGLDLVPLAVLIWDLLD